MVLRSFGLASAAGFACSLLRSATTNTRSDSNNDNSGRALCDDRRKGNNNPHPAQLESAACRCVIIGGGFVGAKTAYYLDSMFDVTLIDEKNFFEMSYSAIPLLTRKWNEVEGDDLNSVTEFKKFSSIHRFYLKRANVVTGTATNVTETEVVLKDGRRVPYDLLFLATGAQKPFPFSSSQRTLAGRIDEIKNFNKFLREKCNKVAIIGGGPAGVSLAASLAEQQPEKEIVLFHSHDELCPKLPRSIRRSMLQSLTSIRENTLMRKKAFTFTGSDPEKIKEAEEAFKKGSLTIKLNHRVNALEAQPNNLSIIVATPPTFSEDSHQGNDSSATSSTTANNNNSISKSTSEEKGGSFWNSIFGKSTSLSNNQSKTEIFKNVPMKYRIIADELDSTVADSTAAKQKLLESRSIFHRLYFGDSVPESSKYSSVVSKNGSAIVGLDDQKLLIETAQDELQREYKSKIGTIAKEGLIFDDFDYVFDMRGGVPRPIVSIPSTSSGKEENILNAHVLPDGKYRASLMLQLLARPNIFALGKCNNLPFINSCGMSDTQAKTVFGALMKILMFSDPANPKLLDASADGIQTKKMIHPKIMIPLGTFEAAGFSSQKGAVTGPLAMVEIKSDTEHLMRDFITPVFFKQRDQRESKNRIMCWLNEEVTDVTDFCF